MDKVQRDKLSNRLAGVYEDLLGLVAQKKAVDRYVGEFSIAYMVDEEIAYLSGDASATTYFGCTMAQGRTTLLDRFTAMEKVVEDVLSTIDAVEDL
jgi:hypothetical protein